MGLNLTLSDVFQARQGGCVRTAALVFVGVAALAWIGCATGDDVLRTVEACPDESGVVLGPEDSIQTALDAATDGDTICLLPGRYTERLVLPDAELTVVGLNGWTETIIDAERLGRVVTVLEGTGAITLQGLTLTGGFTEGNVFAQGGAGVAIQSRTVSLVDVRITDNEAHGPDVFGAGVFVAASSDASATFRGTRLRVDNNVAVTSGGTASRVLGIGISVSGVAPFLDDTIIADNRIEGVPDWVWGGGLFSFGGIAMTNTVVIGHHVVAASEVRGAGIHVVGVVALDRGYIGDNSGQANSVLGGGVFTELVDFQDVDVVSNQALGTVSALGGGIEVFTVPGVAPADSTFSRVRILGNLAAGDQACGGGFHTNIRSARFDNVVVAGNELNGATHERGAGLASANRLDLSQMTIAFNRSTSESFSVWLQPWRLATPGGTIHNSIVSTNQAGGIGLAQLGDPNICLFEAGRNRPPPDVTFGNLHNLPATDLRGIPTPGGGSGNVSFLPMFRFDGGNDPQAWDLRLRGDSPLVDAGDFEILDADGTRSDQGAYGGPNGADWPDISPENLAPDVERR